MPAFYGLHTADDIKDFLARSAKPSALRRLGIGEFLDAAGPRNYPRYKLTEQELD
jgi:hypothetical protein